MFAIAKYQGVFVRFVGVYESVDDANERRKGREFIVRVQPGFDRTRLTATGKPFIERWQFDELVARGVWQIV